MTISDVVSGRTRSQIAAAAVGIHVCIGSVYAFSVWKPPLLAQTGWKDATLSPAFSLSILFLGLSAAFLGGWIDKRGPRAACLLSTILFGSGLALSALSVHTGNPLLLHLGYGVVAGVGLGIGYVTPVSTLVRWFPDRRGFATGLATMGFGFGALLAAPAIATLAPRLGAASTFSILAVVYAAVMFLCSSVMRNPPSVPLHPENAAEGPMDPNVRRSLRSPAFLLLWLMFFINICCGIALISVASPLARELAGMSESAAATLVGVMGLFNGFGRIAWSSASDRLGRPLVWLLFFSLQAAVFFALPHLSHPLAFQACVFLVLTCYGGGFATAPAFLGDLFGSEHLSSLYGVLLTAWAAAGLAGPSLVTFVRLHTGGFQGALTVFGMALLSGLALLSFLWNCLPKKIK